MRGRATTVRSGSALRRSVSAVLLAGAVTVSYLSPSLALELPYQAELVGVEDSGLRDTLSQVSRVIAESDRPPPTLADLQRRIEADRDRLLEALDSFGYYAATLTGEIDEKASPVKVTLKVTPGEAYHVKGFTITGANPALTDGRLRFTAKELGLTPGMVAAAKAVVDAEERLLAGLGAQGYPLAKTADRQVVVDHADRSLSVAWKIDTGPAARFGKVTVEGLESIDTRLVRSRLPWTEGESFDIRKLGQARTRLIALKLFESVRVQPGESVDGAGRLPVAITVKEGPQRSVSVGLSYSTSEGPIGEASWEHRNFYGAGEQLKLGLETGLILQRAKADLRVPGLDDPRITWLGSVIASREDFKTQRSFTIGGSAGAEYLLSDTLKGRAGISAERAIINDGESKRTFNLIGLPLGLAYDGTADLLNPIRGERLTFDTVPFLSVASPGPSFLVARLAGSVYTPLQSDERLVLASWGRIGTIVGADSTLDVPATKRLYGGGPSSVRAYGFQKLGPKGSDGDPTGGRSQLEFGTELRYRMFEDIGGVVFLEGGNVYDDQLPGIDQPLLFGGGFGLRYYTAIGPVRLDIAFPINGRDRDGVFQFYIGLGQAF